MPQIGPTVEREINIPICMSHSLPWVNPAHLMHCKIEHYIQNN